MRRTALAAWVLTLVAGVAGCGTVASIRPLYTDADLEKPIVDARIEGEWINAPPDLYATREDDKPSRWKITAPEDPSRPYNPYSIEIRSPDADKDNQAWIFNGRLVSIGGTLFLDAEFSAKMKGQAVVRDWDRPLLVPTHVIGRVWLQPDFLRLAFLSTEWVKANSAPSLWSSYSEPWSGRDLVFTGSTEEWRQFVVRHADGQEAFAISIYLCRPGTGCTLRATEGELGRSPDDDDLLNHAAQFYSTRANHVRAVALRRHRADLKADDAWLRDDLGEASLLNRDFAGARIAFAAAERLALAAPTTQSASAATITNRAALGIAWSYFLEGRYAEVVKAAEEYRPSKDDASAQPILLTYASLVRLGRRTDAESQLSREAATFNGSSDEHFLLLDAQRRLSEWSSSSWLDRERAFFGGLREIAAGRADLARPLLKDAASKPGDSVVALAATIELERLGPAPGKE